ncbi:SANT domain containing protein [Parasponia andersonii]|uniref:SANT domain containing protein n=1 Tax=Parasponia andersonii TaxID=3476 RepID=A0A2P5CFT2_PARAD|nr:SANT domain containing protein [Parasponia andersonii]
MEVESVELDHNGNCIRETSIESLISPGSPDSSNIFGDPLLNPRIGDEYQVNIPDMITEYERLKLLANPIDSRTVNTSHSFLMGLPIPITWFHDEDEGLGSLRNSDDTIDTNMSFEARNGKKDRAWFRKKSSEVNAELDGSKSYYPIPGLPTDPWSDSEVDSFLLGLYIFGKNFFEIKRFMGNKDMGEVLSFYYGKFYRSGAYRRWSGSRKIRRKKCVTGRKIFTGWRQQELLSRLSPHVPEESQNSLLEGYKSFAEGRISLEEYVSSLKSKVSIPVLVEAVGIGTGKQDLTGFAMDPGKSNHDVVVCPLLPTGQACSSLTSDDIVNFLTGGFRLSKARCNDIFWEAVWPRLLAKGWHSEQPKNQGYLTSKHYLVFLMPGIQKFSRRRLVKGEHYFDSVSDVLNKVASEPKLLELEAEESSVGGQNELDAWSAELASDQDSDSQRHCYLKPRVSTCTLSQMKFTVVDTSLIYEGKSSSIRELRQLPVEFGKTARQTNYSMENERDDSEDDLDEFETVEKPFHSDKTKHHKGRSESGGPNCMKFTVVDTSQVHGGKLSKVRELRYPPAVVKSASEVTDILRKTAAFEDSSCRQEKDATDITSKGTKKMQKSNSQKDKIDSKNHVATKSQSDTTSKMVIQTDLNTSISGEKQLKTVLHQFKRRSKSGHSDYVVPIIKRRRLTACAKEKTAELSENGSLGLGSKQTELQRRTNSPETGKNIISQVHSQEKESSDTYLAESSPDEDVNSNILRQNCFDMHISEGRNKKHQAEESNKLNPPQGGLLDSRNNENLIEEEEGSGRGNMNGCCSPSKEKELVSETYKTSTDVNTSEQKPIMNRRQSKRNRPLTARALEALANGFLNVQRRPKSTEILSGENHFSSPCRKARSKVKVTTSHGDPVTEIVASGKEKEVNGDCDDKKQMISKPLDQVEEMWLSDH